MSIPKVKIAVLKNLLIFDEKYLPQSVRLLEGGGGVETLFGRMPFEHALSLHGASLSGPSVAGPVLVVAPKLEASGPSLEEKQLQLVQQPRNCSRSSK